MKSVFKKLFITAAICALALVSVNVTEVQAAKKYTVTFIYGTNVATQVVKAGKNAAPPVNVDVPGFTFAGWTDTAANIQSDKVILGMYTPIVIPTASKEPTQNKVGGLAVKINNNVSAPACDWWDMTLKGEPGKTCVLRWYNGHNGEIWKVEVVPYGTTLDDPGNPCIEGYDFVGWEGSWENITEDRNIKAWYYHKYCVTFRNSLTGEVMERKWVRDGENVSAPYIESGNGIEFTGDYSRSLDCITGDCDIIVYFKKKG